MFDFSQFDDVATRKAHYADRPPGEILSRLAYLEKQILYALQLPHRPGGEAATLDYTKRVLARTLQSQPGARVDISAVVLPPTKPKINGS